MIDEVKLQNPAGFIDPAGEAQIGFGRAGIARRVIVLCGARSYVRSAGQLQEYESFYQASVTRLLHITRRAFLHALSSLRRAEIS